MSRAKSEAPRNVFSTRKATRRPLNLRARYVTVLLEDVENRAEHRDCFVDYVRPKMKTHATDVGLPLSVDPFPRSPSIGSM